MSGDVSRLIQDASPGQLMILAHFIIDLWPDVEIIGGSWQSSRSIHLKNHHKNCRLESREPDFRCLCSYSLMSLLDEIVSALWKRVLMTNSLWIRGWCESNNKFWSVCVFSLSTDVSKRPFARTWTDQSRKVNFPSWMASWVSLIWLFAWLMCSKKAEDCRSFLILNHYVVTSTYLNRILPLKLLVFSAVCSNVTTMGETGEPN